MLPYTRPPLGTVIAIALPLDGASFGALAELSVIIYRREDRWIERGEG